MSAVLQTIDMVRGLVAAVYELAGGNIYFLCVYCLYVALAAAIQPNVWKHTHNEEEVLYVGLMQIKYIKTQLAGNPYFLFKLN